MVNLIHKDLSSKLNGILFDVHNELGKNASEGQVCDLIESKLKENNLEYDREFTLTSLLETEKRGRHRVDFLIENKIVLEIKYKKFLTREDYAQVQRYLKVLNLALGVLVNFREDRIKSKRILNGSGKE